MSTETLENLADPSKYSPDVVVAALQAIAINRVAEALEKFSRSGLPLDLSGLPIETKHVS